MDALVQSYGAALGFEQCWSKGMVEGGAGEELGVVRLEQCGMWRLGHGAAVSTSATVSTNVVVRGARRGLRQARLSLGGAGSRGWHVELRWSTEGLQRADHNGGGSSVAAIWGLRR